jgi:alkylation response protein AidB-like acyl-CoA dehydrogenase
MHEFLLTPEQKVLRDKGRDFIKSVDRQYLLDMDAEKIKYPKEFIREMAKRGLVGLQIPKEYGGAGLKWAEEVISLEEIGVAGYILACTSGVTGTLVPYAINFAGTKEQKEKYLPRIAKAEIFAAECLTEPRGGSDFFGSTTLATRDGDDFILNGEKRFIVGGEGADIFLVYAKSDPTAGPASSMTCFIVEREMGVKTEYLYNLLGCRGGGTARLVFDNVRVPKENVLGEIHGAYPIFNHMMIPERFGTAAMTIGAARPALEIATDYTTKRRAFGKVINKFQGVSFQIAEAALLLDVCRSYIYTTAKCVDDKKANGADVRRQCSQSKKFVTETCWNIVNKCMQVMGGIAYTDVYPIEKIVRDIRLATIWTGSNEVMSNIIQHEWYTVRRKELEAGTAKRESEFDCNSAFEPGEKIYG